MAEILDPLTSAKLCVNFKTFGAISLAILFAIIALLIPKQKPLYSLEITFNRIARNRKNAIFLVGLLTFLGAALVSFIFYWPKASIHDEFGYLLAADTFAHGRLTNPTHPMWIHFETFHILHQPTYMAKFPPGQGLILAFGQILTGYPVVGVWLSIALACASVCWMLQAWLPPRWALLGGLLMMLRLGLFSYWAQSYWGGAVATIGGALVFGSMRRIIKKPKPSQALLFALGLAILANTRPYEGAVLGLIAGIVMFIALIKKKAFPIKVLVGQVILPVSALLIVVLAMMAYYNWCVTGNPLYLPYSAYENTYSKVPIFLWGKPVEGVTYNHKEFTAFFQVVQWNNYLTHLDSLEHFFIWCNFKLERLWRFFLDWVFTLPLIALIFLLRNYWVKFALVTLLVLLVAMMAITFNFGHYAAPITCLVYFLVLQSIRRIYFWKWNKKPVGQFITLAIPSYCIVLIILPIALSLDPMFFVNPSPWESPRSLPNSLGIKRAEILSELNKIEGNHLVIVHYQPGHSIEREWVFNDADIDNSKVVWAREMNRENVCRLMKYFYDRKPWVLEVDDKAGTEKLFPIAPCQ